jgi:hypothetical protein
MIITRDNNNRVNFDIIEFESILHIGGTRTNNHTIDLQ